MSSFITMVSDPDEVDVDHDQIFEKNLDQTVEINRIRLSKKTTMNRHRIWLWKKQPIRICPNTFIFLKSKLNRNISFKDNFDQ